MIPYGRQSISEDDIQAVADVLRSDFLTQGPAVPRFEEAFAARVSAAHAVSANSATSALHAAYRALGLGPGHTLWTSPITFVATANAALMCGADVDFVDVDPTSALMDPGDLADRLHKAKSEDRLPHIVVPVHMAGRVCDMPAIRALADEFGVRVVEDASHAVGAADADAPVGACAHADIAVFSFHPVKILTTGEGGLATTNDADLAASMRRICSHGVTRDPQEMHEKSPGAWYYEQIDLGYNYRMTDMQAALGLSQLARLDAFLSARRARVRRYEALLEGRDIATPGLADIDRASWHLYIVQVPGRGRVFERLRAEGIWVQVHYIPVHTQPFYRDRGFAAGDFPKAEAFYAGAISLPLFPALSDADQDRVVEALRTALDGD